MDLILKSSALTNLPRLLDSATGQCLCDWSIYADYRLVNTVWSMGLLIGSFHSINQYNLDGLHATSEGPLLLAEITLCTAWTNTHIHCCVVDVIINACPNFHGGFSKRRWINGMDV